MPIETTVPSLQPYPYCQAYRETVTKHYKPVMTPPEQSAFDAYCIALPTQANNNGKAVITCREQLIEALSGYKHLTQLHIADSNPLLHDPNYIWEASKKRGDFYTNLGHCYLLLAQESEKGTQVTGLSQNELEKRGFECLNRAYQVTEMDYDIDSPDLLPKEAGRAAILKAHYLVMKNPDDYLTCYDAVNMLAEMFIDCTQSSANKAFALKTMVFLYHNAAKNNIVNRVVCAQRTSAMFIGDEFYEYKDTLKSMVSDLHSAQQYEVFDSEYKDFLVDWVSILQQRAPEELRIEIFGSN